VAGGSGTSLDVQCLSGEHPLAVPGRSPVYHVLYRTLTCVMLRLSLGGCWGPSGLAAAKGGADATGRREGPAGARQEAPSCQVEECSFGLDVRGRKKGRVNFGRVQDEAVHACRLPPVR